MVFTAEADKEKTLLARMEKVLADPEHPVLAAAVGVLRDHEIRFAQGVGCSRLDGGQTDGDTKYRIASISKLLTAVGIWQLLEQGRIDGDADVSRYLGFALRNPAYPDTPITVKMLLSHTSSIRDGGKPGSYNIPLGHPISEFFTEGAQYYNPRCWAPEGEVPGVYFAYCNMNYCLLGTVLEAVSGERFDRYMTKHIFAPMGLTCGFHVGGLSPQARAQVGTLYRKLNDDGIQDPVSGIWRVQCDEDPTGEPRENYESYVPGTNGSLFGPMGSLRISIRELCCIMQMFCGKGSFRGVSILRPETVEKMFAPAWRYDPEKKNGDNYGGLMNCYGMGPHIFTDQAMGDRLVEKQVLPFAGHTAEAYGLTGGMAFDREKGNGIVYYVAGLGGDMAKAAGAYSAFYRWEEALLTAAAEFADFPC